MMLITDVSIIVQLVNMYGTSFYYNRRKSLAFRGSEMEYMWQAYIGPQTPHRSTNRLSNHLKRSQISNVNIGMEWEFIN